MDLAHTLPIPFLLLIMLVELLNMNDTHAWRRSGTNLLVGLAAGVVAVGVRGAFLALFVSAHTLSPLGPLGHGPTTWILCFVLNELCFYAYHRAGHRVRLLWAAHRTHHSDEHYDLSVGFRLPLGHGMRQMFWLPLPLLGFDPLMVMSCEAVTMIYGYLLHTERDLLPARLMRNVELVFNTPALHRVHHASNPAYLDRNYGGMLVVWDRLFGTYTPLGEAPRYGLTEPEAQQGWLWATLGGYTKLWHGMRCVKGTAARVEYLFQAPNAPIPTGGPSLSLRMHALHVLFKRIAYAGLAY